MTLCRILISAVVAAVLGISAAVAAGDPPPGSAEELLSSPVFTADGSEVGVVAAVSVRNGGDVAEIRVTTASPLGLGARTVILPRDRYMVLRGAVVVDLSQEELNALPAAGEQDRKSRIDG